MKSTLAALAISAMMALPASAATLTGNVTPGGTYDALSGPFDFNAQFVNADVAGVYDFTFTNLTSSVKTLVVSFFTINQAPQVSIFRGGVLTEWLVGGASHSTAQAQLDSFSLSTKIAAGGSDTLRVTFGNPVGRGTVGPDIDFVVAAVPVPAAGMMLAGALAGLGFLRRRKKAA